MLQLLKLYLIQVAKFSCICHNHYVKVVTLKLTVKHTVAIAIKLLKKRTKRWQIYSDPPKSRQKLRKEFAVFSAKVSSDTHGKSSGNRLYAFHQAPSPLPADYLKNSLCLVLKLVLIRTANSPVLIKD